MGRPHNPPITGLVLSSEDEDLRPHTTSFDGRGYPWVYNMELTGALHRIVAERMGLVITGEIVDHINRNILDARRSNLRIATPQQSVINRGLDRRNTSGHTGVTWSVALNCWRAYGAHSGKFSHSGYFADLNDAVRARRLWEVQRDTAA